MHFKVCSINKNFNTNVTCANFNKFYGYGYHLYRYTDELSCKMSKNLKGNEIF